MGKDVEQNCIRLEIDLPVSVRSGRIDIQSRQTTWSGQTTKQNRRDMTSPRLQPGDYNSQGTTLVKVWLVNKNQKKHCKR